MLLLNPLEQKWTRAFVLLKINAYLLAYALFFVTLFVFLLALDKSGALKRYSSALHASSFKSRVYMPVIRRVGQTGSGWVSAESGEASCSPAETKRAEKATSLLLTRLQSDDQERRRQYDELIREVEPAHIAVDIDAAKADAAARGGDATSGAEVAALKQEAVYDAEFNDYLLMRRCYLGCEAIFFEQGFPVLLIRERLREGLAENFLLYMMNNHSIASCVYACKRSSHSRNSRRWVLIVQHAVGFFVTNIVGVLFLLAGVGAVYSQATAQPATSYFASQLFDIFVASPIALAFGEVFRRLYRCDVSVSTIEKRPRYVKALTAVRKGLVIPLIILGVLGALVICAVLTTGQDSAGNITNYMRDVFLVTAVLDLVCAALNFVSTYHYAVYLLGGRLCLLSVGQLYVELLLADGKKEGVDYKVSSYNRVGGVVRIDKITDIDIGSSSSSSSNKVCTTGDLVKQASFTQLNPMHQRVALGAAAASGGSYDSSASGHRAVEMALRGHSRTIPAADVEEGLAPYYHLRGDSKEIFETTNPLYARRGGTRQAVLSSSRSLGAFDRESGSEEADVGAIDTAAPMASFEIEVGEEEEAEEAEEGAEVIKIKLKNRRASFVKNLVFFENLFGAKRLNVNALSRSMVVGSGADAAIDDAKL